MKNYFKHLKIEDSTLTVRNDLHFTDEKLSSERLSDRYPCSHDSLRKTGPASTLEKYIGIQFSIIHFIGTQEMVVKEPSIK